MGMMRAMIAVIVIIIVVITIIIFMCGDHVHLLMVWRCDLIEFGPVRKIALVVYSILLI